MAITRAQTERIIVGRLKSMLTKAGLDTSEAGANPDLNDPVGWAIRRAGGTVTNPVGVTDADVATVATSDTDLLFDLAEARTLETLMTRITLVDVTVGPRSEKLSQLAAQIQARLGQLWKRIETEHGYNAAGVLQAGLIIHDFAEKDDLTDG